ncbi:hypothetical protein [Idiomarina piscisalsi]|uniref:LPP20 lipoprotein n=2 Tax=Idiomarina piscisalsi TaxID=1096243 RepID=A0ABM6LS47_9GAMM|nr:hypothetical protein [Idiomarina piscisalsi]ASG65244.1 hypothetical protein CEW91_03350 [Idiomarina piscisalsi]MTJ03052.1 hypothetical protein [Idiomarina piscisalsi]
MKKHILTIGVCCALAACASQPKQTETQRSSAQANSQMQAVTGNPQDSAPGWVFLPKSDKGLASSACVDWSGNMSVDRPQAVAAARADMAQQISIKASVLDKLYNRKLQAEGKSDVGSTFEQVTKQVSSETLEGSTPQEISLAQIDGKKYLCALVVKEDTRETFDTLVEESNRQLDPQSKAALYEEFRTQKAMKELEKELENL